MQILISIIVKAHRSKAKTRDSTLTNIKVEIFFLLDVLYLDQRGAFSQVSSVDKPPFSLELHQFLIKADPADYFDIS